MKTVAIIPAGGQGKRFGESLPKQYHQINGKEILIYTLEIFQHCSLVDEIVVAAQKDFFNLIKERTDQYQITKMKKIVEGGKERQDSVYNALVSFEADKNDLIAVHDAARPLLSNEILENALKAAKIFDNILVCLKNSDTLIKGKDVVHSYIDRENIFHVQTPQIFRYEILKKSMGLALRENFYGTDESMLVVRAGYNVKIVAGSVLNFKITSQEDVEMFKKMIQEKL
ncbi:MAG: 2-C-methyl-D-erythritol 4-phosphate cytidylyltransferase [Ignavibacteriales bacterium]|nr:2-C-methyl-D-erythritol 4-phosphate cytidylyltransferase [Ignavibacteriales bacterium]